MKTKTIIETPFGTFQYVRHFYGTANWKPSCELCDLRGCESCLEVNCRLFDTEKSTCYLKRLAKPSVRLNTPSEARREAAGK